MGPARAVVAVALVLGPLAAVACGGGAKPAASSAEPAASGAPGKKCSNLGEGIGLGSFDAGPDACWVEVDAAAFAGKRVNGRLAPEIIQRVVRGDFHKLKACYERALAKNATLQGKVTTRFVIDLDGNVESAEAVESTLADVEAVACMVQGFREMRFPKPEGGKVTVQYPIIYNPGE